MQQPANFKLIVFNVGQGDNILIKLPNDSSNTQKYGLIDFHFDNEINNEEPPSISYLQSKIDNGEKIELSFVHISHYHYDHIKGLSKLNSFLSRNPSVSMQELWLPLGIDSSKIANSLKSKSELNDMISKNPTISEEKETNFTIELDALNELKSRSNEKSKPISEYRPEYIFNTFTIFSIAPGRNDIDLNNEQQINEYVIKLLKAKKVVNNATDRNLLSSIIKATNGSLCVSLGGDACLNAWNDAFEHIDFIKPEGKKSIELCKAHIFKVSHHGSTSSSEVELWKKLIDSQSSVSPHFIFSAGTHKKYEHPHQLTIEQIEKVCIEYNKTPKFHSTNHYRSEKKYNNKPVSWEIKIKDETPLNISRRVSSGLFEDSGTLIKKNNTTSQRNKDPFLVGFSFDISSDIIVNKLIPAI